MTEIRVLVTGAGGQLGCDLIHALRCDDRFLVTSYARSELDVTDLNRLTACVLEVQPDAIVNAAAFTDVDACESEQDFAYQVNALGARNIAIAARQVRAKLVHISTDYVFDGEQAEQYREYHTPAPQTVYGRSKLLGERFVQAQMTDYFILRTAWLYGASRKNFVKTMLRLADDHEQLRVVNDQHGSPTWAADLARQILALLPTQLYGTYHASSQGACTWYEFACEIFWETGVDIDVVPVSTEEFPRPAPRPRNSVLDNHFLRLQNMDSMPHWRDALAQFFNAHRPEELTLP